MPLSDTERAAVVAETEAAIVAWLLVQQHGRTSDNFPGYYARGIERGEYRG